MSQTKVSMNPSKRDSRKKRPTQRKPGSGPGGSLVTRIEGLNGREWLAKNTTADKPASKSHDEPASKSPEESRSDRGSANPSLRSRAERIRLLEIYKTGVHVAKQFFNPDTGDLEWFHGLPSLTTMFQWSIVTATWRLRS